MSMRGFGIGGFPFEIHGPSALMHRLESAWRPFIREGFKESEPRLPLRIQMEVTGPAMAEPVVQLALPSFTQPDAAGVSHVSAPGFEATLDADRTCMVRGPDALFPVDVVVRLLLARDLAERGGLLVHGVGIAEPEPEPEASHDARAMLFTGDSGAGKSTLGRCAEAGGLLRMSDELVAVEPSGTRGWLLHGTPWNVGVAATRTLTHVGILRHAEAGSEADTVDIVDAIPPSELMRVLLGNVLLAEESPAARAQLIRHVTALLNTAPSIRLTFAPHAQVADALRSQWKQADYGTAGTLPRSMKKITTPVTDT